MDLCILGLFRRECRKLTPLGDPRLPELISPRQFLTTQSGYCRLAIQPFPRDAMPVHARPQLPEQAECVQLDAARKRVLGGQVLPAQLAECGDRGSTER
jgi:hypothetical protein